MKEKYRNPGLKVVALLTVFLYLYPIFIVFRYIIFKESGGFKSPTIALFSLYFGLGITGFFCKKNYYFTTRLLSYISIVIPIFIGFLLTYDYSLALKFLDLISIFVFYIIGVRSFLKDYQKIFNSRFLLVRGSILTSMMVLTSKISELWSIKGLIYIYILAFLLLAMLLKSIENIDEVFIRRGVEIPVVQRKIKNANAIRIILLYVFIIILFNIKDLVTVLLQILFKLYIQLTLFILYVISKVMSPKGGTASGGEAAPSLPFEPGKGNKLLDYLIFALFVAFVIFVVYKILPRAAKNIISLIKYIKDKLTKVVKVKEDKYGDTECLEIVEITKQVVGNKNRKKKQNLYALLKASKNPIESVRIMYAIILRELDNKSIVVNRSDTTRTVLEKACAIRNVKSKLINVTDVYEKVRYGEETPNKEVLNNIKINFETIITAIKNDKK